MTYGARRTLATMIGDCHDAIMDAIREGRIDRQASAITHAIDTAEGKIGQKKADELREILVAPAAAMNKDWRDRDGTKREAMRIACSRAWAGLLTALSKHGVIIYIEPEPGEMDDAPNEDEPQPDSVSLRP